MSNVPDSNNVPLEYTRGQGSFFPSGQTTTATKAGAGNVQSINGDSSTNIKITAGNSTPGVNVDIEAAGAGVITIAVDITEVLIQVVTAFPAGVDRQLVYNTTLGHLYLFFASSSTWVQV